MAKQAQKPNPTDQEKAGTPLTFAVTLTRQAMVNGKIQKAGSSVNVSDELLEELEAAGLIQ